MRRVSGGREPGLGRLVLVHPTWGLPNRTAHWLAFRAVLGPRVQVAQAADGGYYWRVTRHDGHELASGHSRSRDAAVAAAEQWLMDFDRHRSDRRTA